MLNICGNSSQRNHFKELWEWEHLKYCDSSVINSDIKISGKKIHGIINGNGIC